MTAEEIRHTVKDVIANVTGLPAGDIPDNASFSEDLDLDSLSLLEVGVDVDYHFKLGLPEEELQGLQTIDDVVALVQQHTEKKEAVA